MTRIHPTAIVDPDAALDESVEVGRRAILSAHVVVHQFCWIGDFVMSQGNAATSCHVPPYVIFGEGVNNVVGLNTVGLRRAAHVTDEERLQIKEALRMFYRSGLTPAEAQQALTEIYNAKAYARHFPAADDVAGWRKTHAAAEEAGKDLNEKVAETNQVTVTEANSTVLNLRDRGMGMPAAVVLLSPWVDVSDAGDTIHTLENTDPTLHYDPLLKTSAQAYADGLDLTDPRVSPLYSDFSKGFSPALITEGTKYIFLSTSVRMYQALETAGQKVKLDVYEGLWHVFQTSPIPETEESLKKISDFLHQHLD